MQENYKFAFVSNSEKIASAVYNYSAAQGIPLTIRLATMEEALPVARELLENGTDVILGGGGTGKLLRQKLDYPVVSIGRSSLDLLRTLVKARRFAKNIAVTSYGEMVDGLEFFSEILGVRLEPIIFLSTQELVSGISQAVSAGVDCIIGGGVCVKIAKGLGCRGLAVMPSPRIIQRALDEATNIAKSLDHNRKQAAWLSGALDSLHEGVIGVDARGELVLSNTKASEFLDINHANRQKVFAEFFNSIQIDKTLKDGTFIPDSLFSFRGNSLVTNIRPIHVHEEVVGALAAFRPATYLRNMGEKLRRHDKARGFTAKFSFSDLVGESDRMDRLRRRASRFAQADASIYIHGETGTGKELLAHAVHAAGSRSNEPFVAINCAALPDSLLESELFGYEEGAFTGARKGGKEGLFLLANNGTIFLDEIADISPLLQVRLLRVLESQEILQVGGSRVIPVSVRVISSSWKNLTEEARKGKFRTDLYYRLNTLSLQLPPLRARFEDLPAICAVLLRRIGLPPDTFSSASFKILASYSWPGNIRELDALIRRYALLSQNQKTDNQLLAELLQEFIDSSGDTFDSSSATPLQVSDLPLKSLVERYEQTVIRQTLDRANQSRKLAASQLGISENTLWRKLKYGSSG